MVIIFWMLNRLEAIQMDLDEEEDAAVYEWFYDPKPLLKTKFVPGLLS